MLKHLISIHDYSREDILKTLEMAAAFEKRPNQPIFSKKVVASVFFEPSTRTRLSFETAANRLGARVVGFSETTNTSLTKGESLKDTIKMVSNYADLIVMRHPLDGSTRYASEVSSVPVINAGDGSNQHPTQTLLDLYSIIKTQGDLNNLKINVVGDLKYGRTVHSLLQAMSHFKPTFKFISPEELRLPQEYREFLSERGIRFSESKLLTDNINNADIIYMTRVQKERFSDPIEYERIKDVYTLNSSMLKECKPNMKILHPLPRVNEIAQDVDSSPHAYYFAQAQNGVFTRMAIIASLLGRENL
ncbi:MAG: aspartate carbamoyltransferase [Bacteroidales bacterium]|nr:aspartate carbamoyltransferase [Bacteroidales bacterium]